MIRALLLLALTHLAWCEDGEVIQVNSVDYAMVEDYQPRVPYRTQQRWRTMVPPQQTDREIYRDHADHHQRMQDQAMRDWKFHPNLLCTSAGVHGLQKKTALGMYEPWLQLGLKYKSLYKNSAIPVYSGLMVYVSYKYRFIYLRQQKSSSTSIIQAIKDTFCGGGACDKEVLTLLAAKAPREMEWADYFVFTWVRNPWLRMASSYNMLTNEFMRLRVDGQAGPGKPCGVPFIDFAKDSYELVAACELSSCCLWDTHRQKWAYDFIPGHLNDQSHAIFLPDGGCMVDFVGRTEHITQDWNELVSHLEARTGATLPRVLVDRINYTNETEPMQADDFVPCLGKRAGKLTEEAMRYITRQYAADVIKLGYHL